MTKEFITTSIFDKLWNELSLTDNDLCKLQNLIMQNPSLGDIIEGTGGAIKIRFALPNKGKSGSIRVIYADIVHTDKVYLLLCYSKNKQDNLTADQKSQLKSLIKTLKA